MFRLFIPIQTKSQTKANSVNAYEICQFFLLVPNASSVNSQQCEKGKNQTKAIRSKLTENNRIVAINAYHFVLLMKIVNRKEKLKSFFFFSKIDRQLMLRLATIHKWKQKKSPLCSDVLNPHGVKWNRGKFNGSFSGFLFFVCLKQLKTEYRIPNVDARMSDKSPDTFQTKFDTKNFQMFHG